MGLGCKDWKSVGYLRHEARSKLNLIVEVQYLGVTVEYHLTACYSHVFCNAPWITLVSKCYWLLVAGDIDLQATSRLRGC